jgi:hypothetical protein
MRRSHFGHGWLTLTLAGLAMAAGVTAASASASAAEPKRLVVLELFTSQGCSSCPPADALLHDLARAHAELLPLAFHVTYWNSLGWRDPYSFDAATDRQRRYARQLPEGAVYTPQLVVDGTADVVGSDRAGADAAIRHAASAAAAATTLAIRGTADEITIDIAAGSGAGTVYLVGYDPEHRTQVGRGENSGRTLVEANIVRSFVPARAWTGGALRLRQRRPEGERIAVFVQAQDGRILAAAREADHAS